MYEITEKIAEKFDIRKLKSKCNIHKCENIPDKEILLYEYKKFRKNGITNLYLCNDHSNKASEIIEELKTIEPNTIINKEMKNLII